MDSAFKKIKSIPPGKTILLFFVLTLMASLTAQEYDSLFSRADTYRYHAGDSLVWSNPNFDDADWGQYHNRTFPNELWQGMGWFRQCIEVDTSLWNASIGISVIQAGAVEIYVDGDLVYKRGVVSADPEKERPYFIESITEPKKFKFKPKKFSKTERPVYLLAVRYSAHILDRAIFGDAEPKISIDIGEYSQLKSTYLQAEKKATNHQMFLTGFFLALSLLHTLLYLFYPKFRANGLFAILAICAAVMNFLRFDQQFSINVENFILNITTFHIMSVILIWTMLYLIYFLLHEKKPKRLNIYTSLCLIIIVSIIIWPLYPGQAISILIIITMIDMLFTVIHSFYRKEIRRFEGGWIILISFIPILSAGIYLSFIEIGLLEPQFSFIDFPIIYYSLLLLFIGFSIFLSYNFSGLNKSLLRQLDEVKRLSQKTLEQEVEKAHLEAENARKSKELEEARHL